MHEFHRKKHIDQECAALCICVKLRVPNAQNTTIQTWHVWRDSSWAISTVAAHASTVKRTCKYLYECYQTASMVRQVAKFYSRRKIINIFNIVRAVRKLISELFNYCWHILSALLEIFPQKQNNAPAELDFHAEQCARTIT